MGSGGRLPIKGFEIVADLQETAASRPDGYRRGHDRGVDACGRSDGSRRRTHRRVSHGESLVNDSDPNDAALEAAADGAGDTAWSRAWLVVLIASTMAVAAVTLIGPLDALKAPVMLWFVAICPGMAMIRLVGIQERTAEIMLALGLSIALAGLVPAVFLYLGAWYPALFLTVLVAITSVGILLDPLVRTRLRTPVTALPTSTGQMVVGVNPTAATVQSPLPATRRARRRAPPVALVRQLPNRPPATDTSKSAKRASSLGTGLGTAEPTAAMRTAFDRVVGDIAERRRSGD